MVLSPQVMRLPILFHEYIMLGTGVLVPGARAYRCWAVKHRSNFFRCGMETEMSFISSRTSSRATLSAVLVVVSIPFCDGSISTRRRFCAGSNDWLSLSCSYTKSTILLKSFTREGESFKNVRKTFPSNKGISDGLPYQQIAESPLRYLAAT
jgi:hypothetical protein